MSVDPERGEDEGFTPVPAGPPPNLSVEEIDRLVMKPAGHVRLGKYILLGRLGHGGMGKIYLATSQGPAGYEKLVVVKRLHSHLTADPVLVQNFLDEARLSMALSHPNIVSTFEAGQERTRYFIVMEYLDGQNLSVVLKTAKRAGLFPPSTVWAQMFCHVLSALHAAHTAKDARSRPLHIIHRDVSPQNILLGYDGRPKLVDFGIAKAAMRVSETDAGVLKGKYAYMSPEQVRGDELDARSDVFAAGIVLWEMLAGRRLFKADSVVRSVDRILHEAPISPVRLNPACHPGLAQVCLKALQKDREARFDSAESFQAAIEEVLRPTHARDRERELERLVVRLFAPVIEQQRAIIDRALAALDAGETMPWEPDSSQTSTGEESQSDVGIISGSGNSGAPTQQALRGGQSQSGMKRNVSLVPAAGANVTQPTPLEPGSDERPQTESTRTTEGHSTAPAPVQAVGTTPDVHDPHQRARLWWAATAGALAVVVAVLLWPRPVTDTPSPTVAHTPQRRPPPASATPPPVAPPPVEPPVQADAERPPAPKAPTPKRALPDNRKPETKVALPAPTTAPPAGAGNPAPASVGEAKLSLDTVPWTEVFLGETRLGETPLVNVTVPAGRVEVRLVNAEQGINQRYVFTVDKGGTLKQRLSLK